jgi:hypothetical protein
MKKTILLTMIFAIMMIGTVAADYAWVEVFGDNFNRPNSGIIGNNWTEGGGDGTIVNGKLELRDFSSSIAYVSRPITINDSNLHNFTIKVNTSVCSGTCGTEIRLQDNSDPGVDAQNFVRIRNSGGIWYSYNTTGAQSLTPFVVGNEMTFEVRNMNFTAGTMDAVVYNGTSLTMNTMLRTNADNEIFIVIVSGASASDTTMYLDDVNVTERIYFEPVAAPAVQETISSSSTSASRRGEVMVCDEEGNCVLPADVGSLLAPEKKNPIQKFFAWLKNFRFEWNPGNYGGGE